MAKDARNASKHLDPYATDAVCSRGCAGKRPFTSAKIAKSYARRIRDGESRYTPKPGVKPMPWAVYAYRSPACRFWHLGHNPKKAASLCTSTRISENKNGKPR